MMRKIFLMFLTLLFIIPTAALAEFSIDSPKDPVLPARAVLLRFVLPEAGKAAIALENEAGETLCVVAEEAEYPAGENRVWWNGTYNGVAAPAGEAFLALHYNGERAAAPVTIGEPAPFLTSVVAAQTLLTPEKPVLRVQYTASRAGSVRQSITPVGQDPAEPLQDLETEIAASGSYAIEIDARTLGLVDGNYQLSLQLWDGDAVSDPVQVVFAVFGNLLGQEPPEAAGELLVEEALVDDTADLQDAEDLETEHVQLPERSETNLHQIAWLNGNDQRQYTPSYGSPFAGQDTSLNYWTLPMDITNEAAVWEMLMQPMTVVHTGKKNAQKAQITIRREPNEESDGVGVVTCVSQGVHVLGESEDGEWTHIECYSSSFHDSKVKAWNMLVQGWVPSKYIRTVKPYEHIAMVVDKLTQRLYIFMDGKLHAMLLVSTGLANPRQPYNESRSGEFVICSAVGEIKSDNIYGSMALRYNSGDLLHEVTHTKMKDGGKNFTGSEPKLGNRASHGCIRVQRKKYPNGVNMKWIWENIHRHMNTKIVIWEDWQGRQIIPPSEDTVLYYNPKGGKDYHSHETCYAATGKTFTAFTYGELETEPYASLKRCAFCTPPLRLSEIAEINDVYAPGGDHSPVMTEARIKQGF